MKMGLTPRCGGYCMLLAIASLVSSTVTRVDATVYVDAPFAEKVFDSVAYFDFKDTRWPYIDGGDMLIGPTSVLTSASFDEFFIEYQTAQQHNDDNEILPDNSNTVNSEPSSPSPMAPVSNDFYSDFQVTTPPNFLIVEYGSSPYSSSLENIRHVAEWINADFVVLVVNRDASWKDKFMFWWSHKFPGIPDGVLEKESQIVNKNNSIQCAFLAIGARQGRAMMNMLETYEEWDLESSKEFYFGIDSISTMVGRTFGIRVGLYLVVVFLFWRWTKMMDHRERLQREGAEEVLVKYTGDDLGMGEVQTSTAEHECCVCLESMPQGEKVRILPCRHVFHHECINGWFEQCKFTCPMCKMDLKKHLEERRQASEELDAITAPPRKTLRQRLWQWGRKIESLNGDHLIADQAHEQSVGDLELTEDSGVIV